LTRELKKLAGLISRQQVEVYTTIGWDGPIVLPASDGMKTIVARNLPWPNAKGGRGRHSLVVYNGLANAIRRESALAICHG